jgi:DNA-binding SARP family transcriptional activator
MLGGVVGETLAVEPVARRPLRVFLAGGIALLGADGTIVGERAFAGRQARRLFVRLAAIHESVPQVELADDLWGPTWPASWQLSLRALVSKLRATLALVGARHAISSTGGTYTLRLPAGTWLDLDAASAAIHLAETKLSGGDLPGSGGWALAARAIASRPLLPGEEGEWLDGLRRRLTDQRLRALERLGETWIAHGDPVLAARDAAEAIGIDPFRESTHRLLIRAHIAARDRAAAAKAFATCRRLLEDELGVAPSRATVALLAPLRTGAVREARAPSNESRCRATRCGMVHLRVL